VSATTLVTIDVEGEEYSALVRERQRDVILRDLLHVDFLAVSLTETVKAQVRLSIVGVAPAIKAQNAVITQVMESLEIEALPTDLIEFVEVDVSSLEGIGDTMLVKDIPLPKGVSVMDDPDSTVVVASAPEILEVEEEEEEEEELELVEGEPEVIEKGKSDEEEEDFE
jgi:large subunit ribosomal protein L25